MFKAIKLSLIKHFISSDGNISWLAVGGVMFFMAELILQIPSMHLSVISVPPFINDIAIIIKYVGGGTAIAGFAGRLKK